MNAGDATGSAAARRGYEFGLLDRDAKKEVRRACLKALALPGYQVPFSSREMPIGRGFGTGGMQITLSIAGPGDVIKIIDQGADDSVNACNIRQFYEDVCPGLTGTLVTDDASIVQTRHRVPETPFHEGQVFVLQVPYPDPLQFVEHSEAERVRMHGEADYARLYVKLYEDIVHMGEITLSHRYPVHVHTHYIMDPSPIPRWDVPSLHQCPAPCLFGAGREKKIYAVPPYTDVLPIEFEDVRFRVEDFRDESGGRRPCARCRSVDSFLDELVNDDGSITWACSDTEYCHRTALGTAAAGGRDSR